MFQRRSYQGYTKLNVGEQEIDLENLPQNGEDPENKETAKETNIMDFDSILVELGEFGRFQAFNYLLVCLPVFFSAANSLTYVFTAGVPSYRCVVPGCDNATYPEYSQDWLSNAIPDEDLRDTIYTPAHCLTYLRNLSYPLPSPDSCPSEGFLQNETERCNNWVYNRDEYTIVNEWGITCIENQWKLSMVGTLHFAGILVGSFLFGYLADRFGRKLVLVMSLVTMSVTGIAQAVSPSYVVFQIFVFFNAIATAGVYPLAFILGVEMVGPSKREMSSIVINYFYAVGEASVGVVAWLSGNWKTLQLAVSGPPFVFILYYWLVPESVRWLLTQRKIIKARSIISQAARTNGVVLSEHLLFALDQGAELQDPLTGDQKSSEESQGVIGSIKLLCRSKRLMLRSLNLFFNWAANAFVFYGLSVNSTSLGGNKYVNFIAVCLAEIPGYTMAWLLLKRGRRLALCGSLLLCAVTCLGAAFVPPDVHWAVLTLFLIGKVGITSSFAIIYVYTAELYPTPMRSASVGACSMMARIGAMVAPFVPLLGVYSAPLPLILFGIVSLAAGILGLLLPETMGIHLPDTVKDAETL